MGLVGFCIGGLDIQLVRRFDLFGNLGTTGRPPLVCVGSSRVMPADLRPGFEKTRIARLELIHYVPDAVDAGLAGDRSGVSRK